MSDGSELLGKTVRVWDAMRSAPFVEGRVVAWTERPTIGVKCRCECGREKVVSHVASLPIEVLADDAEDVLRALLAQVERDKASSYWAPRWAKHEGDEIAAWLGSLIDFGWGGSGG